MLGGEVEDGCAEDAVEVLAFGLDGGVEFLPEEEFFLRNRILGLVWFGRDEQNENRQADRKKQRAIHGWRDYRRKELGIQEIG